MAEEVRKMLSLNPKDFVAGGLLNDVDVEFMDLKFEEWTYPNSNTVTLALRIDMLPAGEEVTSENHWSVGSLDDFEAVNEGRGVDVRRNEDGEPVSSASQLRQSSNFKIFADSLLNCGGKTEEAKLGAGDITVFKHTKAHVLRQAAPKRIGLEQREGRFEPTVLVMTKATFPWDKGKRAAPSAKPTTGAAAAAPVEAPAANAPEAPVEITAEFEKMAQDVMMELCEKAPAGLPLKTLRMTAYRAVTDHTVSVKKAVSQICANEQWLTDNGFTVTEGLVKM